MPMFAVHLFITIIMVLSLIYITIIHTHTFLKAISKNQARLHNAPAWFKNERNHEARIYTSSLVFFIALLVMIS